MTLFWMLAGAMALLVAALFCIGLEMRRSTLRDISPRLLAHALGLWLLVQRAWQHRFPEFGGPDPLAGRSGCGSCDCAPDKTCDSNSKPTDTEAP